MIDLDDRGMVHVHQGEHVVCDKPTTVLATVLGSCVAACMHDPVSRVGGMNHFLLPEGVDAASPAANSYGVHLMELLLNGLLKAGARRDRIQVKLFGGARMIRGLSDIGAKNADFAVRFLEHEGLPVVGMSLRGQRARRLNFWPASGRTRQLLLSASGLAPEMVRPPPLPQAIGEVDLF